MPAAVLPFAVTMPIATRAPWGVPLPHAARWALCCLLGLSAAAKLATPWQEDYAVPAALYYGGALVEMCIAVLLHHRWRRCALAAAVLLAAAGIGLAIAVPGRLCGCFGSLLPLEGTSHVLLSGVVGALACLAACPGSASRPRAS